MENKEIQSEFITFLKRTVNSQPINVRYNDLRIIQSNSYWMSEKSDGQRCYIFIRLNEAFICDRKLKLTKLDTDIFKNISNMIVILDGELINSTYIPFDILFFNNVPNCELPYSKRLGIIFNILKPKILSSERFNFAYKKFYKNSDNLGEFKYPDRNSDGIIFTPEDPRLPVFKYKKCHTIDFKIKAPYINPVKLYLYGEDKNTDVLVSDVHLNQHVIDQLRSDSAIIPVRVSVPAVMLSVPSLS
jgi:hypothetical protein